MRGYWTLADEELLARADTFESLLKIALDVLARIPKPVGIVCGPMTTGGCGSLEKNLEAFEVAIKQLTASGVNIWSQLPCESHMQRVKNSLYYRDGNKLLDTFYKPLFESELISTFYFLPGWESSQGATWEHKEAQRLGIGIVYL